MHTQQRPLQVSITLHTLPCPIGFELQPVPEDSSYSSCMCNDEDNINIQNCKADNTLILTVSCGHSFHVCGGPALHVYLRSILLLQNGLWGVENRDESGDRLTTYPCPQHYCQCLRADNVTKLACQYLFDPRQPNEQCFCKRKGTVLFNQ